jgi:hypothetical protein
MSTPGGIPLTISSAFGAYRTVVVPGASTVRELAARVETAEHTLIYGGRVLPPDSTLDALGIPHNAHLIIVPALAAAGQGAHTGQTGQTRGEIGPQNFAFMFQGVTDPSATLAAVTNALTAATRTIAPGTIAVAGADSTEAISSDATLPVVSGTGTGASIPAGATGVSGPLASPILNPNPAPFTMHSFNLGGEPPPQEIVANFLRDSMGTFATLIGQANTSLNSNPSPSSAPVQAAAPPPAVTYAHTAGVLRAVLTNLGYSHSSSARAAEIASAIVCAEDPSVAASAPVPALVDAAYHDVRRLGSLAAENVQSTLGEEQTLETSMTRTLADLLPVLAEAAAEFGRTNDNASLEDIRRILETSGRGRESRAFELASRMAVLASALVTTSSLITGHIEASMAVGGAGDRTGEGDNTGRGEGRADDANHSDMESNGHCGEDERGVDRSGAGGGGSRAGGNSGSGGDDDDKDGRHGGLGGNSNDRGADDDSGDTDSDEEKVDELDVCADDISLDDSDLDMDEMVAELAAEEAIPVKMQPSTTRPITLPATTRNISLGSGAAFSSAPVRASGMMSSRAGTTPNIGIAGRGIADSLDTLRGMREAARVRNTLQADARLISTYGPSVPPSRGYRGVLAVLPVLNVERAAQHSATAVEDSARAAGMQGQDLTALVMQASSRGMGDLFMREIEKTLTSRVATDPSFDPTKFPDAARRFGQ